jgi:hypothetical protein
MTKTIFTGGIAVLLLAAPVGAADDPQAAEQKVMEYLKKIDGAERARVNVVKDSVARAFPKHTFVAVLYPQFPVGRAAPKPLSVANVLAVDGDGKVVPLTDVKELQKFFMENAAKEGKGIEDQVTLAWMRLAAELSQDGFYKFKLPELTGGSGEGGGQETSAELNGKIAVDATGGNKGEIKATVHFKNGVVVKIDHKVSLIPGPRPICQATKLLDPDPIVRTMAEDSIRVMGSACKFYLDEQRAKASPDLQKAIYRIWQRIVEEGR